MSSTCEDFVTSDMRASAGHILSMSGLLGERRGSAADSLAGRSKRVLDNPPAVHHLARNACNNANSGMRPDVALHQNGRWARFRVGRSRQVLQSCVQGKRPMKCDSALQLAMDVLVTLPNRVTSRPGSEPGNTLLRLVLPQVVVDHQVAAKAGRSECYPGSGPIEPGPHLTFHGVSGPLPSNMVLPPTALVVQSRLRLTVGPTSLEQGITSSQNGHRTQGKRRDDASRGRIARSLGNGTPQRTSWPAESVQLLSNSQLSNFNAPQFSVRSRTNLSGRPSW